MERAIVRTICFVAIGVFGAGCSGDESRPSLPRQAATSVAGSPSVLPIKTPPELQSGAAGPTLGVNIISNGADAAVVAKVIDVGAARFNSEDGKAWNLAAEDQNKTEMRPRVNRPVIIEVTEVVFSNGRIPTASGKTLELSAYGDGTVDSGDEVVRTLSDGTKLYFDQYDTMLQTGTEVFLLLVRYDDVPMYPLGTESFTQVLAGYEGSWRIDGDLAANIDPARTVPLDDLIRQILYERSVGRVAERDADTFHNPLGGTRPPADWRPPEAAIPSPEATLPAPTGATGVANAEASP